MPRTMNPGPMTEGDEGPALRSTNPADRIALRGVRLTARLSGMGLRAVVEQTFVNLEPRAIEAVYTFPLPESAAVCGFEVLTADRLLTGTIDEAEEAEEKYHDAISQGDGAFIAEQHRPDVFSVRVGNLKPRQAATIRLTYVCALERVDRQIRVAFPTTIAPRYGTATATDPIDAAIDADALNPPHVLSVPYGLSLRAEIDLGREVVGVLSPSHAIDVAPEADGKTVVTLAAGLTEMNRDVVLSLRLAKEAEPRVQAAAGPDGANYLAVTFVPEFDDADLAGSAAGETVFVLDCSGSMMGDSIRQAKAALELCLRSLSPGDTFNICRFGSSFEMMASEPVPYTQKSLDAALKYVRDTGDLGGTEIHAPLEAIFSVKPRPGVVRQVILLTDGQVTNEPAVVDLCRKHRARNRVFSFGIGAASSAFLVKGVARATGGAAEFIGEGERIDEKVLRTFARLASPAVTDVKVDWDDAEVQTLAETPPIFDGDVLALFGRCAGRLPGHVTLSCKVAGEKRSWRVSVPPAAGDDRNTISTLWARRTIQSMEEVNGAPVIRHRKGKLSREQETIVRLSKTFNLLSSLTTFLCIEHRSEAERNAGTPALRRVPLLLAEGWGEVEMLYGDASASPVAGGRQFAAMRAAPPPMAAPPAAAPARSGLLGRLFSGSAKKQRSRKREQADAIASAEPGFTLHELMGRGTDDDALISAFAALPADGSADRGTAPGTPGTSPASEHQSPRAVTDLAGLLNLQQFDGSFGGHSSALDTLLHQAGGDGWPAIVEQALPATVPPNDRPAVIQTVLVLLLLHGSFAAESALWSRAATKATKLYLAKQLGMTPRQTQDWLDGVRAALK